MNPEILLAISIIGYVIFLAVFFSNRTYLFIDDRVKIKICESLAIQELDNEISELDLYEMMQANDELPDKAINKFEYYLALYEQYTDEFIGFLSQNKIINARCRIRRRDIDKCADLFIDFLKTIK